MSKYLFPIGILSSSDKVKIKYMHNVTKKINHYSQLNNVNK